MYSWDDLAGLARARQFPDVPGRDVGAVADALDRIGPIQAQTARAPFLGLAARLILALERRSPVVSHRFAWGSSRLRQRPFRRGT